MPDKINQININGTSYDIQDNVSGYITGINAADVSSALGYTPYNATNPNGYVNAAGAANAAPVQSVNGQTGTVVLNAANVGALPDDTDIPSKISDLTNDQVYDLGVKTENDGYILLEGSEAEDILAMWNRGMCALVVTVSGRTYVAFKEQVITFSGLPLYSFVGTWSGLNENGRPVSSKVALALSYFEYDPSYIMFALIPDVMSINGVEVDNNNEITLNASDVGALPDDTVIPSKTSDLTNDSGFITGISSADVTTALGYTPYNSTNPNGYVNATGAANAAPVQSVNNKTGAVSLTASDVGALPDDTSIPTKISDLTNDQVYDLGTRTLTNDGQISLTSEEQSDILAMWNRGACAISITISGRTYMLLKEQDITYFDIPLHVFSGTWIGFDVNDNAISKKIALAVSTLTNYPIAMYASINDVLTVNGHSGTVVLDADDVGALPDDTVIPTKTSDLTNDSGFITGMTILSYGSSTWQDFLSAYNSNQVIYCRASSNSNPASGSQTRLAFMAYVSNATSPTNVEFQYYRSMSSHSATSQGDEVYVYKLASSGTWTVTVRKASPNIVAGTGLSRSYSNDTVTLSLDGTIPTKTSDLTNDSGYITLSDLPIYDGTVIIGT